MNKRLKIISIGDIASQGVSEPYLCGGEDGEDYFVKGLRSGRHSQINEWICANIAHAVGLPIASFCLLETEEELFEELDRSQKGIGLGCSFGSLSQKNAVWFELGDIPSVSPLLQKQIAAFDWLVKNGDRQRGNPNLLIDRSDSKLVVIDHNLAFDKASNFRIDSFIETHIFGAAFKEILQDLDYQDKMTDFLRPAAAAYRQAVGTLPKEWQWTNPPDSDLPTNYDFEFAKQAVLRAENGTLWREP